MALRGEQDERTEYWQMHYPQAKGKLHRNSQKVLYSSGKRAKLSPVLCDVNMWSY